MIRFNFFISYKYSIDPLLNVRAVVSNKICYKNSLHFLKVKHSLTKSLSNRIAEKSNFRLSYFNLREYYIRSLRANFTNIITPESIPYLWTTFDNKKFLSLYSKTTLTRELDYILLWRANQTNALFNLATTITKKKKKYQFKHRTFFIFTKKRLLFVWRWLKIFIRSTQTKGVPHKLSLIRSLENFLLAPEESQMISIFKLQVYKLHLLRIT